MVVPCTQVARNVKVSMKQTGLSTAQPLLHGKKCQYAAKSVSSGDMNECLKVTIAMEIVYFTTQQYTGPGKNTVLIFKM